jgi:predicted aspartyl protease
MRRIELLAAACAVAVCLSSPSLGDDAPSPQSCALQRYTSLPLRTETDGRVSAPLMLNDRTLQFVVDTGGLFGGLSANIASSMGLKSRPFPYGNQFVFYGRVAETRYVTLDRFGLGDLSGTDFEIPLMPASMLEPDEDGLMGGSVLSEYDVEIDFLNEKMNLFSQDHCPNRVVYWTNSPYARVPLELDEAWHISVPVQIDGKTLKATIDTGAGESVMTLEHARDLFGWDEKSTPVAQENGYIRAPFKTLTFEGVQVTNPNIHLLPKAYVSRGAPELLLGINILRQLHLYIAYKEKMLYLTPAEAPPFAK